jgi:hypothetical protein
VAPVMRATFPETSNKSLRRSIPFLIAIFRSSLF